MNQPQGRRTTATLHHADALSYSQLFLPGRDWWSVAPATPDICLVSELAEFFDPTGGNYGRGKDTRPDRPKRPESAEN
jgi:hypothetical protein